jgi:hypothetical protein
LQNVISKLARACVQLNAAAANTTTITTTAAATAAATTSRLPA